MDGGKAQRIELALDAGAALLCAAAVGTAAARLWPSAVGIAASALGFVGSFALLRRIAPLDPGFSLPGFELQPFDDAADGELLLTDEHRLAPTELLLTDADRVTDELMLDDVLAELGTDSRVVRLFDRLAMPTPGELRERIDRHLAHGPTVPAPPDASQALHDALAELRRSLR
jgi:hypothetical protein